MKGVDGHYIVGMVEERWKGERLQSRLYVVLATSVSVNFHHSVQKAGHNAFQLATVRSSDHEGSKTTLSSLIRAVDNYEFFSVSSCIPPQLLPSSGTLNLLSIVDQFY